MKWAEETFKNHSPIRVSNLEANSSQTVFAKEIFAKLALEAPEAKFYWILGEDQLEQLPYWKDIDSYAPELFWIVFPRSQKNFGTGILSKRLLQQSCAYSWTRSTPMVEISSQRLRRLLETSDQPKELEWIPESIRKDVCETYQKGR